ncbi:hypothetical protein BD289DRAFT_137257 [Coniella lustricola]|uniref:Uncharacterized protein n=1 Tax=Coniella lustricola TaxID=2025994 RepID=A0A2T2ZVQ2_9PEZI|nr:hypothetical protein BD289DRAFT_137257 [Coniella lustricola]
MPCHAMQPGAGGPARYSTRSWVWVKGRGRGRGRGRGQRWRSRSSRLGQKSRLGRVRVRVRVRVKGWPGSAPRTARLQRFGAATGKGYVPAHTHAAVAAGLRGASRPTTRRSGCQQGFMPDCPIDLRQQVPFLVEAHCKSTCMHTLHREPPPVRSIPAVSHACLPACLPACPGCHPTAGGTKRRDGAAIPSGRAVLGNRTAPASKYPGIYLTVYLSIYLSVYRLIHQCLSATTAFSYLVHAIVQRAWLLLGVSRLARTARLVTGERERERDRQTDRDRNGVRQRATDWTTRLGKSWC